MHSGIMWLYTSEPFKSLTTFTSGRTLSRFLSHTWFRCKIHTTHSKLSIVHSITTTGYSLGSRSRANWKQHLTKSDFQGKCCRLLFHEAFSQWSCASARNADYLSLATRLRPQLPKLSAGEGKAARLEVNDRLWNDQQLEENLLALMGMLILISSC